MTTDRLYVPVDGVQVNLDDFLTRSEEADIYITVGYRVKAVLVGADRYQRMMNIVEGPTEAGKPATGRDSDEV